MTMERCVAKNNADNNDRVVLLPLPSMSLANMVAAILLVRTLFDTHLPSPPSSSALPPTCLFWLMSAPTTGPLQALVVSHCWPSPLSHQWLVVASMPASRFVVRHLLSSLQVSTLLLTAAALFHCPLPSTFLLLSFPAAACLCHSSVDGWLLRLCPLCRPPPVPLSAARFHHLPPSWERACFCCWPLPPFAAHHQPQLLCLSLPISRQWLVVASSALRHPPSIFVIVCSRAIIDALVANTE